MFIFLGQSGGVKPTAYILPMRGVEIFVVVFISKRFKKMARNETITQCGFSILGPRIALYSSMSGSRLGRHGSLYGFGIDGSPT